VVAQYYRLRFKDNRSDSKQNPFHARTEMSEYTIRLLESPEDMAAAEELQRIVWPGSETDVVPAHLLITAVHNGGIVLGAFVQNKLVGFIFGFPGLVMLPDGPHPKHCSHMMGVHPEWRDSGLGFALKRAQWQMVRHQGLDHITWTYDPLISRNAYLNIAKLGAVCNTYRVSEYGDMRDGLNAGLPSDRFQVDWWVYTPRVEQRLSRRARPALALAHYLGAKPVVMEADHDKKGIPTPAAIPPDFKGALAIVEIPADFDAVKSADMVLALAWRMHTRRLFETAFKHGYLVTDFVHENGRSYYVLTHGESTF
jgi:predicted GNAT superfamily acetyltransferase